MADAASLPIGFPEVAVVEEDTLPEQSLAVAAQLPQRPLVLGGCCCAHVGVVEGLGRAHERLAVVWLDAHGDLNTIESSPSGNPWATPLRVLIDGGVVGSDDVALVGARNLDPPEEAFIAEHGVHTGPEGDCSRCGRGRRRLRGARRGRARRARGALVHAGAGRARRRHRGRALPGARRERGRGRRRPFGAGARSRPQCQRWSGSAPRSDSSPDRN